MQEYKIIEIFYNDKKRKFVKFLCEEHGEQIRRYDSFEKTGCIYCKERKKLKPKFTYMDIKNFVETNSDCQLLSTEYKNNSTKMKFKCSCNEEFETTFSEFKHSNKRQCNKCGRTGSTKWKVEEIKNFLSTENYTYIDKKYILKPYQNQLWVFLSCPNEAHEPYWVNWNNFIRGYKCDKCYKDKNNITTWDKETIINFFKEQRYELLNLEEEWKSVDDSLSCKNGDYFYYTSITNLKACIIQKRKPSLFNSNPYAMKNLSIFCENERPDYKIISTEYKGVKEIYTFEYIGDLLKEGVSPIFETTIDLFYHGRVRHPQMNKTIMEETTEIILVNNNIKFISQWTNHNCINIETNTRLRFDVAILNFDKSITKVIELDGESHYMGTEFWGGSEGLKLRKYRDNIKTKYCQDNNIKLLRIPYWDFDKIETILKEHDII
jgi:hypothetical protein